MAAHVEIGDTFAGYRVEAELARGGMGVVYRARDVDLDRVVALKLIRPDLSEDDAYRQRFRAESRTAAKIEHPNVVSIYEARELDGTLYLVMQFIQGHDLRTEIVQSGRLSPELAVSIVEDAAAGLDAVHAAGLVHRDVKPANILISRRGGEPRALVTDFGVARSAAATTSMTETGQFVGTLDYVAPEQLQGLPIDARTDVYALGCLLYETITGQVPFPGNEGPAKMFGHVHGEVPSIDPAIGPVADDLTSVVFRALEKHPDDRFPSAGDLGRAARAALAGREPAAAERTVGVGDAAPSTRDGAPIPRRPLPPPPSSDRLTPPPPPPPTEPRPRPQRAEAETVGGGRYDDGRSSRKRWLGGAVVALLAAGLIGAAILLAVGGKDDGGGGEQQTTVAQRDERTKTVTETTGGGGGEKTVTTTTNERPAPEGDPAAAAAAAVSAEGYAVADTSDYNPANTLGALVGSGADGEKVFFFVDGEYIGTDTADASGDIDIVSSTDTLTEVSYGIYVPTDSDCCPSGGRTTVRYSWTGSELQPLDPIPPTDPGSTGSRR